MELRYSVRILDQLGNLLGVLPVMSWGYDRKLSESTQISVSILKENVVQGEVDDILYYFMYPSAGMLVDNPVVEYPDGITTRLAFIIEIYRDTALVAKGRIAKRTINTTSITIQCHTEEALLTDWVSPANYGRVYEGLELSDVVKDLEYGWSALRVKSSTDWYDSARVSDVLNIDRYTELGLVMIENEAFGGRYAETGYITLKFASSEIIDFTRWDRIRWLSDNVDPVSTTMAYRTFNGSYWSTWSEEYEGAYPDEIGIPVTANTAEQLEVRITLVTDDRDTQDALGNIKGVTPVLYAVEVLARTKKILDVVVAPTTNHIVKGLVADNSTVQTILKDALQEFNWEYRVFDGVCYVAQEIGTDLSHQILMRSGTNMEIDNISDDDSTICNYLIAIGRGSGIDRIQTIRTNNDSIIKYGVRQKTVDFDTDDHAELGTLADAYMEEHREPWYSWKIKGAFPYGEEPVYQSGDYVKVSDDDTGIVLKARILEERREYGSDGLKVTLFVNKTRDSLVRFNEPIYANKGEWRSPKNVAIFNKYEGAIIRIPAPAQKEVWRETRVYIEYQSGIPVRESALVGSARSNVFLIEDLPAGQIIYVKALYVRTDGVMSNPSSEYRHTVSDTTFIRGEVDVTGKLNGGLIVDPGVSESTFEGTINAGGTFTGILNGPLLKTVEKDVSVNFGSFATGATQASSLFNAYFCLQGWKVYQYNPASAGTSEGKTIKGIYLAPISYQHRRDRSYDITPNSYSYTYMLCDVYITYTDNSQRMIRTVRYKRNTKEGFVFYSKYPSYPSFSSDPCVAITEGTLVEVGGAHWPSYSYSNITGLYLKDLTQNKLILNYTMLPAGDPNVEGEVYRDTSGYLKISDG